MIAKPAGRALGPDFDGSVMCSSAKKLDVNGKGLPRKTLLRCGPDGTSFLSYNVDIIHNSFSATGS